MIKLCSCAQSPRHAHGIEVKALYFSQAPGDKYIKVYAKYKEGKSWVPLQIGLPSAPSLQQVRDIDRNIVMGSGSFDDAHFYLRSADGNNMTTAFYSNIQGGAIQVGNVEGFANLNLQPDGGLLNYGNEEVATKNWTEGQGYIKTEEDPTVPAWVKAITDEQIAQWTNKQNALGYTPENTANKSTIVSLGTSNTLYPTQNAVKSYVDNAITSNNANYIATAQKGAINGVASLGSDGKIPNGQIPAIAITDTFVVATQVAMLALVAEVGDVAVRSDINKTFILKTAPATTLANWVELKSPTMANTDQLPEGTTNLYFTNNRARAAISAGVPLSYNATTGAITLGVANASNNGYLSSMDWSMFNAKEPAFSKNTGFNKNFGTTAGTVAQGDDPRILNGQTAFGWGNHAGLYVPIGRSIIAGVGMTGGGTLGSDRTIALGAPSSISLSSTNSVSGSTHSHAFAPGGTINQYIRGDGSLAPFPDDINFANSDLTLTGNRNHKLGIHNLNFGANNGSAYSSITQNFEGVAIASVGSGSTGFRIYSSITQANFPANLKTDLLTQLNRTYQFPNASGTFALKSDIVADTNFGNTNLTATGNRSHWFAANALTVSGNNWVIQGGDESLYFIGKNGVYINGFQHPVKLNTYLLTGLREANFPDKDGTLAMLSDIPAYTDTNFANTDLSFTGDRSHDLAGHNLNIFGGASGATTGLSIGASNVALASVGPTSLGISLFSSVTNTSIGAVLKTDLLTSTRTYQFPNASGTLALTSDIVPDTNIGNTNQTLTGTRSVSLGTNNLLFSSTGNLTQFALTSSGMTLSSSGVGSTGVYIRSSTTNTVQAALLNTSALTAIRTYGFPNASGTLALESWVIGQGYTTNTGTVTSVGLSMPTGFTVSTSPITEAGTLAVSTTLNGPLRGNGSGFVVGNLNAATELAGITPVANGGIGVNTISGVMIGSGTSVVTGVTGIANQLLRRNAANTAYEFFTPTYGTGSVTSITAGNGMNFSTISTTGTIAMGTPGSVTLATGNAVGVGTHTHAFAPGGTTAQYINGIGALVTFPTIPADANNGTLFMNVTGILSGATTFTANQSTNSTFTVTAPSYGTTAGTIAQGNDSRFHNPVTIGTANGLSIATQVLSMALASTSTTGALSSTDWNTFNNKAPSTGGTGYICNQILVDQSAGFRITNTSYLSANKNVIAKNIATTESTELVLGYTEYSNNYEKVKLITKRISSSAQQNFHIAVAINSSTTSAKESDSRFFINGLTGDVGINNLSGTGTRPVGATSDGTLQIMTNILTTADRDGGKNVLKNSANLQIQSPIYGASVGNTVDGYPNVVVINSLNDYARVVTDIEYNNYTKYKIAIFGKCVVTTTASQFIYVGGAYRAFESVPAANVWGWYILAGTYTAAEIVDIRVNYPPSTFYFNKIMIEGNSDIFTSYQKVWSDYEGFGENIGNSDLSIPNSIDRTLTIGSGGSFQIDGNSSIGIGGPGGSPNIDLISPNGVLQLTATNTGLGDTVSLRTNDLTAQRVQEFQNIAGQIEVLPNGAPSISVSDSLTQSIGLVATNKFGQIGIANGTGAPNTSHTITITYTQAYPNAAIPVVSLGEGAINLRATVLNPTSNGFQIYITGTFPALANYKFTYVVNGF